MTAEYPVAPRIAAPPVWHVDKALLARGNCGPSFCRQRRSGATSSLADCRYGAEHTGGGSAAAGRDRTRAVAAPAGALIAPGADHAPPADGIFSGIRPPHR